jgi:predicted glycosyltransferase involved in capsule biosynthesis
MSVVRVARALPDDVTVVIGVRNRTDHRLVNALESIRAQRYPWGRVTTLVVDYGSHDASARELVEVCSRLGADLLRVDGTRTWSRARCLNIGLRAVRTKYVMTSDADVVLSPHYLADAVSAMRADPLAVVCSAMRDLPAESVQPTTRAAEAGVPLDLDALRPNASPRFGWGLHPSIAVAYAGFHRAIRGYDEVYEGWGREDVDLMRRFTSLGLRPTAIPERSFYLHQWHPKHEGIPAGERKRAIERNDAHFFRTHTILRNDDAWGVPPPEAA